MDDRRYAAFLGRRYRAIFGYLGSVLLLVAAVVAAPAALLPLYPGEGDAALPMVLTGVFCAALGAWLRLRLSPARGEDLNVHEGAVLVVLSWIAAIAAGSLPLMACGLDPVEALFESTSGWTTTGLSVVDVEAAPRLLLLYRSTLQLAGGAGFAVVMLSSGGGPAGAGLGTAEGRADLLVPQVRRSARLVIGIYSLYAAGGTAAFRAAGMGWFDAVNHSFAAVSTGGFSTRVDSLGAWDSPAVEAVAVALMLLGSLNFATAWVLLRGRFRDAARDGEVRVMALLIPLSAVTLAAGVAAGLYATMGKAIRVSLFESVTALTTTGFSTVSYGPWNGLGWTVMILLMIVGGGTGSTAGGLKQIRVHALWRGLLWEVRRMALPPEAVTTPHQWSGGRRRVLNDGVLRSIGVYAFLYLGLLAAGTAALAALGCSSRDALFEFASSLGTVGLSSGVTAPGTGHGILLVETAGMFLGRLEVLVVVLFLLKLGRHARASVGG